MFLTVLSPFSHRKDHRAVLSGFSPYSHRNIMHVSQGFLPAVIEKNHTTLLPCLLTQNQTYHSLTCSLPVITPADLLEGCLVTPPLTFILPSLILFGQCFCF